MKKIFPLILLLLNSTWLSAQLTCATAVSLNLGTVTVPDVTGDPPSTACTLGAAGTKGLWYKYTATANKTIKVTTSSAGQNADTRLIVFSGNCNALNCVTANDDYIGQFSQVTFNAVSGTTYYIVFDNKYSALGFNVTLSEVIVQPDRLVFTPQTVSVAGGFNNCIVDMNGD